MLFRNLIFSITIPFYLLGCATMTGADSKSSILYPDPATMSTAALENLPVNPARSLLGELVEYLTIGRKA